MYNGHEHFDFIAGLKDPVNTNSPKAPRLTVRDRRRLGPAVTIAYKYRLHHVYDYLYQDETTSNLVWQTNVSLSCLSVNQASVMTATGTLFRLMLQH